MKKAEFQMKEPMEDRLKKIAHNSADPGEAKWKRSMEHMKQRELVKDMRYPAKINGMVWEKEFIGK